METKDRIKDRILKRAALLWGYTDTELESSFDPIVRMMLEACSSELEKLSAELYNSKTRIVERLLEIMSPGAKSGAIPSHSVVQINVSENNLLITPKHKFFCNKNVPNIYNPINSTNKIISFGTTLETTLYNIKINCIAFNNNIYSMKRNIHKDLIIKKNNHTKNRSLWLGIQVNGNIKNIDKLMFYTDIRNASHKEIFYHYLKQSKIYLNEKEIKVKEGYNVEYLNVDVDAIINKNYSRINEIYTEVNNLYKNKFFYLNHNIEINKELFKIPKEVIKDNLDDHDIDLKEIENLENTFWLEIRFPEVMPVEVLDSVMFYINSLPVINKELEANTQAVNRFINYIPLESENIFLDIDHIADNIGNSYHLKDFSSGNLDVGDATLRHSGIVRFDERSASELIQYVIELMKDEIAAFSLMNTNDMSGSLNTLKQTIASLEQQVKKNRFEKSNLSYVIAKTKIKNQESFKSFFFIVYYWTCLGEIANNIKPGTPLFIETNSMFANNGVYLINTTVGGKTRLSNQEKIISYRESLLTRGRIVTFADIKTFCLKHFGKFIENIEIEKGTKKDISINKGFVRTIDIKIQKKQDIEISEPEWEYLCDSLLTKLEELSSNVYPYRLLII